MIEFESKKQFFRVQNRCPKDGSSQRPDNLALTAIENTSTMKDTRASSVSQPIPVPSQIHNYEKMQESRERIKSLGGISAGSPSGSPFDGQFFFSANEIKITVVRTMIVFRSSSIIGSSSSSKYCFIKLRSSQFDKSTGRSIYC